MAVERSVGDFSRTGGETETAAGEVERKYPCSREALNVCRVVGLEASAPGSGGSGAKIDDAPFAGLPAHLDSALPRQPVGGRLIVSGGGVVQVDDDCTALGIVEKNELVGGNMRQRRGMPPAAVAVAYRDEHPSLGISLGWNPPIRSSRPCCAVDPHEIPV